jgi:UDP:flavonoid glycosyltransferase YjiC (YdhE family)
MRILYGVSGEGFGHRSRARKIIPYLESRGHEILKKAGKPQIY